MGVFQLEAERKRLRFWLQIFGSSFLVLSGFSAMVFAGSDMDSEGRYAIFDAPNASYILPASINDRGEVTGSVIYPDNRVRGFVREAGGKIELFDAFPRGTDTEPADINNRGEVAGGGFLRDSGGHITLFSASGGQPGTTFASGINDPGLIAGKFTAGAPQVEHGYVRSPGGQITTFDIPNGSDIIVAGINNRGDVIGTFEDWTRSGMQRMFVREPKGNLTILDPPNGTPWVAAMNDRGDIAGIYVMPGGEGGDALSVGFFRDHSGTVMEIDISNPGVAGMNNRGEVVGNFSNPEKGGKLCGFIWRPEGKTTILDIPDGTATYAYSINNRGQVTGALDVAGLGGKRRGFVYSDDSGRADQ